MSLERERVPGHVKFPVGAAAIPFALLSAGLLVLSFPRFDLGILAWVALVPWLVVLEGRRPHAAFGLSFLTGISFFMGVFYWINVVSGFTAVDFLLLGIYLGSYFGLFGLALVLVTRRTALPLVLIVPAIWVSLEWLRSHAVELSLPWALLGHSQYANLPLIQIASLTGVYGVSFLIVLVNAVLADGAVAWLRRSSSPPRYRRVAVSAGLALLALVGSLLYGFAVLARPATAETLRVTVVQGNIPQALRWSAAFRQRHLDAHLRLTRAAARQDAPALIVWPETAVPAVLPQEPRLLGTFSSLAREANAHLVVGSAARPKLGPREIRRTYSFNGAFLLSPTGIAGQYHKIRLFPFGEYLPYAGFPWPSRIATQAGHFLPGQEHTTFSLNGARFAVLICWETIFPDLVRQFALRGAELVLNITNEAWFGETAAPYQFLAMNVFRAVENRIAIVRSANTGISAFIDPHGRVAGKVTDGSKDIFVEGYLTRDVPISRDRTLYTRYGDVFVYVNLLFTGGLLVVSFLTGVMTPWRRPTS